jgi:hypothetical protein
MKTIRELKEIDTQLDRLNVCEYLFDMFYDLINDNQFDDANKFINKFIKEDFSLSLCVFFLEISLKYKNILSNREKLFEKTYEVGNRIMLENYLKITIGSLK